MTMSRWRLALPGIAKATKLLIESLRCCSCVDRCAEDDDPQVNQKLLAARRYVVVALKQNSLLRMLKLCPLHLRPASGSMRCLPIVALCFSQLQDPQRGSGNEEAEAYRLRGVRRAGRSGEIGCVAGEEGGGEEEELWGGGFVAIRLNPCRNHYCNR